MFIESDDVICNNIIDIESPTLSISEEYYAADNVTVTVNWTKAQPADVLYSARVLPIVPLMDTGSTSYQLTILYNTEYNLTVVATSPCRPNFNATDFIVLNYGEV